MAARNETLLNPSLKPYRRNKNEHFLAKLGLSTALTLGSIGGLVYIASNINNYPGTENYHPSLTEPMDAENDTSWKLLLPPVEKPVQAGNIPLAELTKEYGGAATIPTGLKPSREYPVGYALSIGNGTITDIEMDKKHNTVWVALTLPGEELTKEPTGSIGTDFNGKKTELNSYNGFTAWIEINNYIAVIKNNSDHTDQGLNYLAPYLQIGKPLSVTIYMTQNTNFEYYAEMNKQSLKLLDSNEGKPNDRNNKDFKFKADYAFVYTKTDTTP